MLTAGRKGTEILTLNVAFISACDFEPRSVLNLEYEFF